MGASMVYQHLKPFLGDLNHEEFYLIMLNHANEIIHTKQVSKGGMSSTIVDGKIIFNMALTFQASAIIVSHNHPSGNLNPSSQDLKLTKSLTEFGKYIDLPLLDHIIFTDNGYFSFAEQNLL